jgi:hypothetical protein
MNSGNTLVIVAIIIIVLIALGIGGYFIYNYFSMYDMNLFVVFIILILALAGMGTIWYIVKRGKCVVPEKNSCQTGQAPYCSSDDAYQSCADVATVCGSWPTGKKCTPDNCLYDSKSKKYIWQNCAADTSCPTNCSDSTCTNKMCTKCNSGYGTKLAGTPASDGSCPPYYKEYVGIDYRSFMGKPNDIGFLTSNDKDYCVSRCVAQTKPTCMFAVTDGTTCWLKNGFGWDAPNGYADPNRIVLAPVSLQVPPTSSS